MQLSEKRFKRIERKVKNISKKYKDPFMIARYYSIECEFVDIQSGILGYSIGSEAKIYINKKFEADSYSARIICAHELGHIFLHDDIFALDYDNYVDRIIDENTIKEYEANVFAILLMPQIASGSDWKSCSEKVLNRIICDKVKKGLHIQNIIG